MKNEVVSKILTLVSILLFISIIITPIITGSNFNDDTTPPITTHALDPPSPDGENGWYVSDVNVTLTATDDMSGVNMTYYRVNDGEWEVYNSTFVISEDGDDILIEYYSVDNENNQETIKQTSIDMDQTNPLVCLSYEWEPVDEESGKYGYRFTIEATDVTSKMNRVELFTDGELYETVYGTGPDYIFYILQDYDFSIKGLICRGNITDGYVKFYAIVVDELWVGDSFYHCPIAYAYDNAGNSAYDTLLTPPPQPEPNYFKWYKFSNDYEGEIGNYYINAIFKKRPMAVSIVSNLLNFEPNNLFLQFIEHFPLLHRLLDIWRHVLV